MRASIGDTSEPSDGEILRTLAFFIWVFTLFTYGWALISMCTDTPFRRMVRGIMSPPALILFAIVGVIIVVTIARVLWPGMPWWDENGLDIIFIAGVFAYVLSAATWVPLTMRDLATPHTGGFPFIAFITQRVPLIISLGSVIVITMKIWNTTHAWMHIGLAVWCAVAAFDAFIWDILYARWLLNSNEDEY